MRTIVSRIGGGVIAALSVGAAANDADLELGRHLASQCLTCHVEKEAGRIPSLSGMPERAFTDAIDSFRSKRRASQIMSPIAERLTDEDIAALARFFASARRSR
jgi:cytochrome c553